MISKQLSSIYTEYIRHFVAEKPFGGKNVDVLYDLFADSIMMMANPRLPLMYDSTIASEYAWKFLQDARMNDLPSYWQFTDS